MYEMKSGDICSSPNWISALIFPESKKKRQFLLVLGLVEMGPNGSSVMGFKLWLAGLKPVSPPVGTGSMMYRWAIADDRSACGLKSPCH